MSKKFYIQVNNRITKTFVIHDDPAGSIFIKGRKAAKVSDNNQEYKIFNLISNSEKPKVCLLANVKQTSYKFKDLADLTHVDQGRNRINIIINDVHSFAKICIIKISDDLAKLLRIGKYIRLININKQEFADAEKLDNRALLARGIDPVGITWIALLTFILDENTSKKDWEYLCESKIKVYMSDDFVNQEIDLTE